MTAFTKDDSMRRHILAHVASTDGPVRASDLLHLGSRASIDQALSRLAKNGLLSRSGRGAYVGTGIASPQKPVADAGLSKRGLIIDAASQLFAARGYFGVSMRDIAEPSGIHIATLYHYFPDKRAIYDAVVKAAWEEGARRTLQLGDTDLTPRQQLESWIGNVLEFHYMRSTSARIRDREIFFGDENGSPVSPDMLAQSARNEAAVADLIRQIDPPILQHMPADRVGEMIYSLAYGIIKFQPAHAFIRPDSELDLKTIIADVLRFVGAALGWSEDG